MKLITFKVTILIAILTTCIYTQKDDLQVNIIPSDKYKINKRDLVSLKSDIERQVSNLRNNFKLVNAKSP